MPSSINTIFISVAVLETSDANYSYTCSKNSGDQEQILLHLLSPTEITCRHRVINNLFLQRRRNLDSTGDKRFCRRQAIKGTNKSFRLPLCRVKFTFGRFRQKRAQVSF